MQFTPNQEQKLQELNAKAHETADQVSQKAQEIAHDVGQKAQEIAHDVKHQAEKLAHKASEKMSEIHPNEIVRDAGELIKKHPMQALATGAIIGGLLGMLVAQRRARRA